MTLKRGKIKRALFNGPSSNGPTYCDDAGFIIDKRFGITRHEWLDKRWILTHQSTGFAVSLYIASKSAAVQCVKALYRKFGRTAWDFTDPDDARLPRFKGALKVIRQFERRERT